VTANPATRPSMTLVVAMRDEGPSIDQGGDLADAAQPREVGKPPGARRPVVWFVNQYAGSPRHGMEFRHYELGRALESRGYTVIVISGSFSHLFASLPATTGTYTIEDVGGLTYCWVKVPAYRRATSVRRVLNMLVFMVRLYRLPVQRLPAPDAIVVSSPSLFPILPAQRWSRRLQARLVFEVRDVWPLTLQELGGLSRRHPLIALMGWFENRAYRVADAVVSVLPAAGSHMESHGMTPSKLSIIPNGVSPEVLGGGKGSAPAQVQAATARHTFNVGFVGTLGTANALDALIEAARVLADDDVGVVIVGGGSEEKRLRALAAGVANVSFTGPVSKVDVPTTLALFDACYVGYHRSPLYRFGVSPNKVFDYMAAARPVILAAAAANDPVRDADCGLTVEPDEPAALAQGILALRALMPAKRARLGANGRAYVERLHSYASLAALYVPVLDPTV
jgi:glycosyltransferase involved in cell wall biosynthesis